MLSHLPHCGHPWVELLDRGHNERPRYVVSASESSMAGGAGCFVAAMEFASHVAQLLGCTVSLRQTGSMSGYCETANRPAVGRKKPDLGVLGLGEEALGREPASSFGSDTLKRLNALWQAHTAEQLKYSGVCGIRGPNRCRHRETLRPDQERQKQFRCTVKEIVWTHLLMAHLVASELGAQRRWVATLSCRSKRGFSTGCWVESRPTFIHSIARFDRLLRPSDPPVRGGQPPRSQ